VLTQSGRLRIWFLFRFDFFPSRKTLREKKDVIIISSSSTLLIPAKKIGCLLVHSNEGFSRCVDQ